MRKLSGRSECHRWEPAFIKAVDSLGIVITEYVSEDNGFDFITFHFVCRHLIQLLLFQCGEKALHTGIIIAMSSSADALDKPC